MGEHKFLLIGVLAAAAALAMVVLVKKKAAIVGAAAEAGSALGEAVGNAAGAAAGGVVLGLGDQVGLPRTNMTECEKALAEGRTWDASFACPAGKFLGSFF
ncbi:hypothetical protein [Janthinobacterium sp.]|uniref:hypothetical protein n=1 Tax=Janthinobacterium sp. TaxID=1871054 RepID=UPI0026208FC6|nr:hypothetical protein [Janthinobacterium sp.]